MAHQITFIILGSHASGLSAALAFINKLPNTRCLDWRELNMERIKSFLSSNDDAKKGVIIDNARCQENGVLDYILDNISNDCLMIIFFRDPVTRLIGGINNIIVGWAYIAAGLMEINLNQSALNREKNIKSLALSMIMDPQNNTVVKLYSKISQCISTINLFDISSLYYQNVHSTLNVIYKYLHNTDAPRIDIPKSLPYSKENYYLNSIKPMQLIDKKNRKLLFRLIPLDFYTLFGYTEEQIIQTFPRNILHLGNFDSCLGLILLNHNIFSQDEIIILKNYLCNNDSMIAKYCEDLNKRSVLFKQLYKCLFLTEEAILEYSKSNYTFSTALKEFIWSPIKLYKNINIDLLEYFSTSIEFLNKLETLRS